jgi:hypothetical protein
MKTTKLYLIASIFLAFTLSSCLKDRSPIVTQTFDLDSLRVVELAISGNLKIINGATQKVEVRGREETLSQINKIITSGYWDISLPKGFRKSYDELEITITCTGLEQVSLTGSGNIIVENTLPLNKILLSGSGNIEANTTTSKLSCLLSGSGNINLTGNADTLYYALSGSGNYRGFNLLSNEANVQLSGSGNIEVSVSKELYVNLSGSGNVYYKGNPTIQSTVTGSGKVVDAN